MNEEAGFRFDNFELNARSGELRKAGLRVRLQEQPFRILLLLLERRGELVTRDELRERLWPADTFVDFDRGLNNAVRRLREVLGDSADTPRFVETLAKRGYRFIAPVETIGASGAAPRATRLAEPPRCTAPPPGRRRLVLAAVVGVCLIVAALWIRPRLSQRPPDRPARVMLVVLPFENLSGDPEQEYISDGLTEEMISHLGRLHPESLGVIARTSAMQYKGRAWSVAAIGRELGVDYALEGSVRRSGDRIRVTTDLVEVRREASVWSAEYEHDLRDILSLQSEVASAIAGEIRLQLTPQERRRLESPRPVNREAFALCLKGRYFWNKRTAEGLDKAMGFFKEALDHDPTSALAYAGLADTYNLLSYYSGMPPKVAFPQAKAAAAKALALDSESAEAHTSLAYVRHRHEWDWPGAEQEYRKALELNPSYATAHHWFAEYLMVQGRLEDAANALRVARQLDPLSLRIELDAGLPFYFAGRYDDAIAQYQKVVDVDPDFPAAHVALRQAYEQKGLYGEAMRELQRELGPSLGAQPRPAVEGASGVPDEKGYWRLRLRLAQQAAPRSESTPSHVASIHSALGEKDKAIEWLEKAYLERDDEIVWINVEPWYRVLRDDARFAKLLERMGLANRPAR